MTGPSGGTAHHGRAAMRAAGVLYLCLGAGFGIPAAIGAAYRARTGGVWHFMDFPTHATGPFFESLGIRISVPLILGFVAACAVQATAGALMLIPMRGAGVLAIAVLPVTAIYWAGFVLPFAPPAAAAAVALQVIGWLARARARREPVRR